MPSYFCGGESRARMARGVTSRSHVPRVREPRARLLDVCQAPLQERFVLVLPRMTRYAHSDVRQRHHLRGLWTQGVVESGDYFGERTNMDHHWCGHRVGTAHADRIASMYILAVPSTEMTPPGGRASQSERERPRVRPRNSLRSIKLGSLAGPRLTTTTTPIASTTWVHTPAISVAWTAAGRGGRAAILRGMYPQNRSSRRWQW